MLSQEPLTVHSPLAFAQTASVQPLAPIHDQVVNHPQEPATCALEIPTEQAYFVARLHEPSTGQAGLGLAQLVALVPPSAPRHDQVDDPPQQVPSIFDEGRPLLQAN